MFRNLINLFTFKRWFTIIVIAIVGVGGTYYFYGTSGPSTLQGSIENIRTLEEPNNNAPKGEIARETTEQTKSNGKLIIPDNKQEQSIDIRNSAPSEAATQTEASIAQTRTVSIDPVDINIPLQGSEADITTACRERYSNVQQAETRETYVRICIAAETNQRTRDNGTPPPPPPNDAGNTNDTNNQSNSDIVIPLQESNADITAACRQRYSNVQQAETRETYVRICIAAGMNQSTRDNGTPPPPPPNDAGNTNDTNNQSNNHPYHILRLSDAQPTPRVLDLDNPITAVYSLRIVPVVSTTLTYLELQLHPQVPNPIVPNDIEFQLFESDQNNQESAISQIITPLTDGRIIFENINRDLPINSDLLPDNRDYYDLIVKAHIKPNVSAAGKSFAINFTGQNNIRFNPPEHSIAFQNAILGNTMSVNQLITEIPDACPNQAGIQEAVPAGLIIDAAGNCIENNVPPPRDIIALDQCLNFDGMQNNVPVGFIRDELGVCTNVNQSSYQNGRLDCSVLGLLPYTGPSRPNLSQGSCIPCPTAFFIQNNGSCEIPTPTTSTTTRRQQNQSRNEPQQTVNSNQRQSTQRGAAFEEDFGSTPLSSRSTPQTQSPDLSYSQRIIRAPERGDTGPGILLYSFGVVLAPVLAYGIKKRKR